MLSLVRGQPAERFALRARSISFLTSDAAVWSGSTNQITTYAVRTCRFALQDLVSTSVKMHLISRAALLTLKSGCTTLGPGWRSYVSHMRLD